MAIQELNEAEAAAVSGGTANPIGLIADLIDSKAVQDFISAGSKSIEALVGVVGKAFHNPLVADLLNDGAKILGKVLGG